MKQPVRRRQPSQARAHTTRLLIFETAVRILEEEGLERLNTNRLAERSGFSVGTIYQYFANKQAIIQALMLHEQEKMLAEVRKSMMTGAIQTKRQNASPRVRAVVRAVLGAFGGRCRARKILIERALQEGQHRSLEHPLTTLTALLTSGAVASDQGGAFTLTAVDAFVLTQAVAGAIRAALAQDRRLLKTIAFEDALVGLIDGFPWNRTASS